MLLLIDNYDSFTFNLYQHLAELGAEVLVRRCDEISVAEAEALAPAHIVISPGPGRPRDAGISRELIAHLGPRVPLLGVCLGHQCIGEVYGGAVVRAPVPVHGKVSRITHVGQGLFAGVASPLSAARYHSLVVESASLPPALEVTATTDDGLIMGLRHQEHPIHGIQFHPESILTPDGKRLLANFLAMGAARESATVAADRADAPQPPVFAQRRHHMTATISSKVESTPAVTKGYRLASREAQATRTQVRVATPRGTVCLGGPEVVIMAGPCAVESEAQLLAAAHAARAGGATLLRGGAYKPSTSPYSFRGLGEAGLELLSRARAATGLGVVTEVLSVETVAQVSACADLLQVGARNMANAPLLEAVGRSGKPVLLKRGWAATIEEWLLAAEYILATGNGQVVLCERGIRTFEPLTRNTLDINAIPLLKELSHLPVVVDPSQGTGRRSLVGAVTLAGVAAGADGVLLEIHPEPEAALKDGAQSLGLAAYAALMPQVRAVANALGRSLAGS
jgi:3-deoxy-7-phosphoheptulonate synthase